MMHFSLIQLLLIVSGALFQVSAYCLFSKHASEARLALAAQKAREEAEAEEARRQEEARARRDTAVLPKIVKYRCQVQGVMEHVPDDVRPADLLRTAKVHFKKSLEVYQGKTQDMPTIRR